MSNVLVASNKINRNGRITTIDRYRRLIPEVAKAFEYDFGSTDYVSLSGLKKRFDELQDKDIRGLRKGQSIVMDVYYPFCKRRYTFYVARTSNGYAYVIKM